MNRIRYLALIIICKFFERVAGALVKPFDADEENRKLLAWFLEWDRKQRQHWVASFSFPLYKGLHPKNVFATRINDLREELKGFSNNPVRLIDFGCGSGHALDLLAPHISEGLGIDLPGAPITAHEKIHARHPQISFAYAEHTPETLKQTVSKFAPDLVLLSHLIEHLENPVDYMKACYPFPLLVCVPSEESWLQKLRADQGLSTSSDSTHFREYSRDSLVSELRLAGYQTAKVRFNTEGELVATARVDK